MFHLFASEWGDGAGGMNDYRGSFETLEEARAAVTVEDEYVWAQIAETTESGLKLHSNGVPITEAVPVKNNILSHGGSLWFHVKSTVVGYKWTDHNHEDTLA